MNRETVFFVIEEISKRKDTAEQVKKALLIQNPASNVKRLNEHIFMCEKAMSQFNKKLLNSEYKIDEQLLKYIIEEFEMKRYLEKLVI